MDQGSPLPPVNNMLLPDLCSNPQSCKQTEPWSALVAAGLPVQDGRVTVWPSASSVLHGFLPACLSRMLSRSDRDLVRRRSRTL